MPNWCYSNITISHYDENRVKELHDSLMKWLNISMENNGFDNGYAWLSNGQKDIMNQTSDGFNSLHLFSIIVCNSVINSSFVFPSVLIGGINSNTAVPE